MLIAPTVMTVTMLITALMAGADLETYGECQCQCRGCSNDGLEQDHARRWNTRIAWSRGSGSDAQIPCSVPREKNWH